MSSHSRYVHGSNRSQSSAPQFTSPRTAAYVLIGLALGLIFVYAADAHARDIEYLRSVGVAVEGAVTELSVQPNSGRQPVYWVSVEYPAVSPSGRDLTLSFRFNVTEKEYAAFSAGQRIDLLYDPDSARQPVRADLVSSVDTGAIRLLSLLGAVIYTLIGVALSVVDWRRRVQVSQRDSKLRSAFGTR